MKIKFIGAAHEVTGSCTYLEINQFRILVDFGMEQGRDVYENAQIPCAPGKIDYVLLTHAHIDHSGLLPLLYAGGFQGEIHTTDATASLCSIMLRDSAHIQEFEAQWRNRKAQRNGEEPYIPLYTMEDAVGAISLLRSHKYNQKFTLCEGVEVRFIDAGHLLGSASIEIWATENDQTRKLVFSGDIGNLNQPLIRDPEYITQADYVIMESTYGDRKHERPADYVTALAQVLQRTFDRGGSVIIPSFAVGRTQELLYFLRQIKEQNLIQNYADFPVFMDSPLAIEATSIFLKNQNSCYDAEALHYVEQGINPLTFPDLILATTPEESRAINFDKRRKVIISASGMCEAGRIKHHLKHNLWQPQNMILFVGYQAYGTLGRSLVEGAASVKLFGETVQVAAEIKQLPGISGHADVDGLTKWISQIQNPEHVFIIHGESDVMDRFTAHLRNDLKLNAYAPYSGTEFDLLTGEILLESVPKPVQKTKGTARANTIYQRLLAALERLTVLIRNSQGRTNKDLARLTDQIQELCNKFEK
ncbi:MAG: MBL fold metallo-hydrolase [Oscillospiraceae bacterium]|nr:MBL fold metallo-hydrolase [Oscillospiraceae bacterium]